MSVKRVAVFVFLWTCSMLIMTGARADTCEGIAGIALAHTTITTAQSVPAGTFTPPGSAPISNLPAFCRVAGIVKPTSDSEIGFEVWMPTSIWNGKYQQVGNGGFGGAIFYTPPSPGIPGMADALRRGYAVAGTDDGHKSDDMFDATWALGHQEKVVDLGYRAVHETAEASKAIVAAFYGSPPAHAYFNGCSSGGREALMEAQRYPHDFDGIVAGAPANFMTHQMVGYVSNQQALLDDLSGYISFTKLPAIQAAALAACDALDGVSDGIISNPSACHFDPSPLLCTGTESNACLTAAQLASLEKIYEGAGNPRSGASIFPGFEPGAEAFNLGRGSWSAWITGTAPGNANEISIANQFFRYMVFEDPTWDFRTFDLDADTRVTDDKLAAVLNATNPHLNGIQRLGGKIIMYHGWNDPAIPAENSVAYYQSVIASQRPLNGPRQVDALAATKRFYRLFMVPGMNHCAGGAAPNAFDMLTPLETWVEQGVPPERVIATHFTGGVPDRTRPLCPYPQVAQYTGTGSTDDAANFECAPPAN